MGPIRHEMGGEYSSSGWPSDEVNFTYPEKAEIGKL
jgi:hypothetical protein